MNAALDIVSMIRAVRQSHRARGLKYVMRVGFYTFPVFLLPWFVYYNKIKPRPHSFLFCGKYYRYYNRFYNCTWYNERCVELAIALDFLYKYQGKNILEVGNVLSNYVPVDHDILDKYETKPNIIKEDVVRYKSPKRYDLIISISTLEHVGYDETPQDHKMIPFAIDNLMSFLDVGGRLLVTLPLGQNPVLDRYIDDRKVIFDEQYYLKRVSKDNQWKQAVWDEVKDTKYGQPYFAANALVIGINRRTD